MSLISLLHSGSLTKINDNNKSELSIIHWRHIADGKTPSRSTRIPHCRSPPGSPVLLLWGFIYRKSELTKDHSSTSCGE
jgi:hypothetical protein